MTDAARPGGTTPVFEDPEEISRTKLGRPEWEKDIQLAVDRPKTWVRLRWFESDRGAERAAIRLRKDWHESDGYEFTSRRISAADGGGSKLFCRYTPAVPTETPDFPP